MCGKCSTLSTPAVCDRCHYNLLWNVNTALISTRFRRSSFLLSGYGGYSEYHSSNGYHILWHYEDVEVRASHPAPWEGSSEMPLIKISCVCTLYMSYVDVCKWLPSLEPEIIIGCYSLPVFVMSFHLLGPVGTAKAVTENRQEMPCTQS